MLRALPSSKRSTTRAVVELDAGDEVDPVPARACTLRAAPARERAPTVAAARRPYRLNGSPSRPDVLAAAAVTLRAVADTLDAFEDTPSASDTPPLAPPVALGITDAARHIGVGATTLRALIGAGELASIMVGGRRLVRLADLDAYVAGLDVAPPPQGEGS